LWSLLNDSTLTIGINSSLDNIKAASDQIKQISISLRGVTNDIHDGKGAAGILLNDQATARSAKEIVENVHTLTNESNNLMRKIDTLIHTANNDVVNGPGAIHLVLRDKSFANKLDSTMTNLQQSTASFNQNMEALKHNFLVRGYFKKEAKRNKRNKAKSDGR
jgi:phospholipid/cholesterol/gamma-HCH transport system substrate-binding protein